MKKAVKFVLWIVVAIALLGAIGYFQAYSILRLALALPDFETESGSSETLMVTMRDGVRLQTHVYLPKGDGPWPTVLMRDPYAVMKTICPLLTRYGNACVHQDVRGRSGSEGEWYPVVNERNDGLDTLDWLIEQPWQNGNIATYGSSYLGVVQWAVIDAMPAQVKTVIADVSHGDWYALANENGHYGHAGVSNWALFLHNPEERTDNHKAMIAHRPAKEANAQYLNGKKQWFDDYLTYQRRTDDFWNAPVYEALRTNHRKAKIPVLMLGAWHDSFLEGQFDVYEELPTRPHSLFAIRQGNHAGLTRDALGFNFNILLDWIDRHLKNKSVDSLPQSGYLIQGNVDKSWFHTDSWPAKTTPQELHLGDLSKAVTCDGGTLLEAENAEPDKVNYVYDPENPVPTRGGSNGLMGGGAVEQGAENCARQDVMSFESDVYEDGWTLSGQISVALQVASSADDSAFTVKVQEKMADGRVFNIRDGITSLSFRNGSESRQEYEAESIVEIRFDLVPIEWTLRPGSSLRLDISSSNYPAFNAHPNVVQNWALVEKTRKATQTLYGGVLSLPIRQAQ